MEAPKKSFKFHPLAVLEGRYLKKAKIQHCKHVHRVFSVEAFSPHNSERVVRKFLKHFFQLCTSDLNMAILSPLKRTMKSATLLHLVKLETEDLVPLWKYKKMFRWCPNVKCLSLRIPYEHSKCLRYNKYVRDLHISIANRVQARAKPNLLLNFLKKLSSVRNLDLELGRVPMYSIGELLEKMRAIKFLGLHVVELEPLKKDEKIELGNFAKLRKLKINSATYLNYKMLFDNLPIFQNLQWLELSRDNHFMTNLSKREDVISFEKIKYLEALRVFKGYFNLASLKYEDKLLFFKSLSVPTGLERFQISVQIKELESEQDFDESLAEMINKLYYCPNLYSLSVNLKGDGDIPALKTLFSRLKPSFPKLRSFTFSMGARSLVHVESSQIFSWAATQRELEYFHINVPFKDLSGFKDHKFCDGSFSKLGRLNFMSLQKDKMKSEDLKNFMIYLSKITSIKSLHFNCWDDFVGIADMEYIATNLKEMHNLSDLHLFLNVGPLEVAGINHLPSIMHNIPKLNQFNLFIRVEGLLPENLPVEITEKFEILKEKKRLVKFYLNQVPIVQ